MKELVWNLILWKFSLVIFVYYLYYHLFVDSLFLYYLNSFEEVMTVVEVGVVKEVEVEVEAVVEVKGEVLPSVA